jgi:hypothetical protein
MCVSPCVALGLTGQVTSLVNLGLEYGLRQHTLSAKEQRASCCSFTQFKMRLEAASIQIGGRPRDNSQQYRRNSLNYYFRNASEPLNLNRKVSVPPMMDYTDARRFR